jgi:hypothetical protein
MSAIRPNRNFDNETTVHTPYSELMKQHVNTQRAYPVNKQPIRTNTALKRNSDIRSSKSVQSVYNKYFK